MLSVTSMGGSAEAGGVMRMRPRLGTSPARLGHGLNAFGSYDRVQLNTLIV